jgi:hypothetical protein
MTAKCVNGIDLDRLRALRDLIETDAEGPLASITTQDDRPVVLGDQEFPDAPRLCFIGHVNP